MIREAYQTAAAWLAYQGARWRYGARAYDAAKSDPYRPRRGDANSGDRNAELGAVRLREYARWAEDNEALASAILDELVVNVVGSGLVIAPMVRNRAGELSAPLNETLRRRWAEWWERPEVTGQLPGPELERLLARTMFRDGEAFVHLHPDRRPLMLEACEPDYVPFEMVDPKRGIVHGVELDAYRRPLAYWVYDAHPGDWGTSGGWASIATTRRIPAERMIHVRFAKRLHQVRGVTVFASAFNRLRDTLEYDETERIGARVAASFSAVITRTSSVAPPQRDGATYREVKLRPGVIMDPLLPGEGVQLLDPKRPSGAYAEYRNAQLRSIAAGVGVRYSAVARDYSGTYSSQRQELVEARVHYDRLRSYLVSALYRPVRTAWLDGLLLAGELRLPRDLDGATLYDAEYRGPTLPWIDPEKEVTAQVAAVTARLRSRHQAIKDLGGDPDQVDAQIEADTLDVEPAGATGPAGEDSIQSDQELAA
jgi:lambda family phage portal protein